MSLLAELNDWYNAPDREASPHKMSGVLPQIRREMSELSRTKYAYFFDGLDDMDLPEATLKTLSPNKEIVNRIRVGSKELEDIAGVNALRADAMREAHKGKPMIRSSVEAKERLQEIKYRESFLVTDALARNMQALVSYHNQKKDGKRFKTRRINPDQTLEIMRIR